MRMDSDPQIERVRDGAQARIRRGWRLALDGTIVLMFALVAASLLSMWATPSAPVVGFAPAWQVEITAAGSQPVRALVYGKEAGFHLVRAPAASASREEARVIPARLARGELHMLSLGWSRLSVRAASPDGAPSTSWSATGRTVTAYQSARGTGVRASW